ncbi:MAG: hypothetical protein GY861_08310 [bacterium]|nr:hypothetical protein [bacterium]
MKIKEWQHWTDSVPSWFDWEEWYMSVHGWICPKCNHVWSPEVKECVVCNEAETE